MDTSRLNNANTLAERLKYELRQQFNLAGLRVEAGLIKNEQRVFDYYFVFSDENNPQVFVPAGLVDKARERLAAWEPHSSPIFKRSRVPAPGVRREFI